MSKITERIKILESKRKRGPQENVELELLKEREGENIRNQIGGDCKKFLVRENPKPYKKNLNLVHGLITCKKCSNVWNRDCNGATNIYKIVKGYIEIKKDRTIYVEAIYKLY